MLIYKPYLTPIKAFIVSFLLLICVSVKAQNTLVENNIHNFSVKQNQLNNQKLTVFVLDSLEQNNQKISGNFVFSINGLAQTLIFKNGEGLLTLPLKKSTFLYLSFDNAKNNPSNLYYVYKKDSGLNPIKVSLFLLWVIPIGLILIGYMFRKIIGLSIFLITLYFYFNHSNGLSFGVFFQSIYHTLKNLF